VDYGRDRGFFHNPDQAFGVEQVDDAETRRVNRIPMPSGQIVDNDHFIAGVPQLKRRMGADIAGTAGDKDAFGVRHMVIVGVCRGRFTKLLAGRLYWT